MNDGVTKVLILGYGAFGQALHCALSSRSDLAICVYMRTEKLLRFQVQQVFRTTDEIEFGRFDIILVTLPSGAIPEVLGKIAAGKPSSAAFISCSKGIDHVSGLLPTQIILRETGSSFIAVLSGASFSEEMLQETPVFVSLACANPFMGKSLIRQLESALIVFEFTDDVRGLEIAGVGKNLIALAAGIADGGGLGENFRATLIARGVSELRTVIDKLGGRAETVIMIGALSDVILTSSSGKSRNYRFGRALAMGEAESGLSEGFNSLQAFGHMLRQHGIRSPYFEKIVLLAKNPSGIRSLLY